MDRLFDWPARVAPGRELAIDDSTSSASPSGEDIEITGDQLQYMADDKVKLQWWDLWALGVSTAIGGHFFVWGKGFLAGFGSYVICYFLIASAYGMLALCMAEMSSAMPFAGGAYGLTRVTLGTLPGFLVGCFDSYQSIFNVLYNTLGMAVIITFAADIDKKWEALWWFLVYVSYMIIHIIGGVWMWRVLKVLSAGSVCLLLIYIFGSIKYANFEENAPLWYPFGLTGSDLWFKGGVHQFLRSFPLPCWFFIGTESINLAAHDCENPKRDVPRAYLLTYATILCTSCAMFFTAASVYPGPTLLPVTYFPTIFGYQLMFNCNLQTAIAISFPAIYTSGFGFTYYYGSQLRAMGMSGLINTWFGYDVPGFKTPVVALLAGMLIGMVVGLRYYWFPNWRNEDLLSISLLGACSVYCTQFVSFIVFRLYYPTIKREFVSPLGIPGAVYGLLVFLLMFIVIAGFENNPDVLIFSVYVGLLIIYYFLVVQKRQVFSEEEKTVLFKAYLIKSNRSKNARIRTGNNRTAASTLISSADESPASLATRTKPSPSSYMHHTTTSTTAAATTASDGAAGGEIDMSQYMVPHSALADLLSDNNPTVC